MMSALSGVRGPAFVEIEYPSPLSALPDAPQPFVVKNTFVAAADAGPSSLLGSSILPPRAIRSCPGSKLASLYGFASACESEEDTSAGASSRASESCDEGSPLQALPEFNYPAPEFAVRNTFVDTRLGGHMPSMVDDAFQQRRVRSCLDAPAAKPRASRCDDDDEDEFTPAPGSFCMVSGVDEDDLDFVPSPVCALLAAAADDDDELLDCLALSQPPTPPPMAPAPWARQPLVPPPPPAAAPAVLPPPPPPAAKPATLPFQDMPRPPAAAPEPVLDSGECPTEGSRHHCAGACRPCAHAFSAKGCTNGVGCQFCHLCAPGELKRRQKQRRAELARERAMEQDCGSGSCRGRRGGRRA